MRPWSWDENQSDGNCSQKIRKNILPPEGISASHIECYVSENWENGILGRRDNMKKKPEKERRELILGLWGDG